jgi:SulP family sulfate permease
MIAVMASAEIFTLLGVLFIGIEEGISLGIILTVISYLRKTNRPHIVVVGRTYPRNRALS